MTNLGVLILAAGQASRMGKTKQLLLYKEKPLVVHAIELSLKIKAVFHAVVLGAKAAEISPVIQSYPVDILINSQWPEGMSSSIRVGLEYAESTHQTDALIIMLADQPLLQSDFLQKLRQTWIDKKCQLVASQYNGKPGVPALFTKSLYPNLLELKGAEGARKILRSQTTDMCLIDNPAGAWDIDTPEDYKKLTQGTNSDM